MGGTGMRVKKGRDSCGGRGTGLSGGDRDAGEKGRAEQKGHHRHLSPTLAVMPVAAAYRTRSGVRRVPGEWGTWQDTISAARRFGSYSPPDAARLPTVAASCCSLWLAVPKQVAVHSRTHLQQHQLRLWQGRVQGVSPTSLSAAKADCNWKWSAQTLRGIQFLQTEHAQAQCRRRQVYRA